MTNKIAVIAVALSISLPASAQTNSDPIKWAWTCKSSGFYIMDAFPDGRFKPQVDFTGNKQVVINIREVSQAVAKLCGDWPSFYYAEMQGTELATLYNDQTNNCNKATPHFEHVTSSTLDKVTGSGDGMSFIVSHDDNDWRFVISRTDLTTEREGRKLRILEPRPGVNYDAEADVWLLTGRCVMTINQDH